MTFTAAVAVGVDADDTLAVYRRRASDRIASIRHEHRTVAWSTACPWIESYDDGEVLVVLDGHLHDSDIPATGVARSLLERYRARGADVARSLLGDFVLIVLDRATGMLLVARDPVGVRPWYQATSGQLHAGASDVATLASLPWVDTSVNESIAIEYLAAVPESRGETIHRGIQTLPPGQTWRITGTDAKTCAHHRWDIEPELDISWDDAAERCREVLTETVRSRLRVHGYATSELSGGLDSSSVVGTAALLAPNDLLVGRLVFEGPRADEREYSDAVIDHWHLRAVSAPPWIPTDDELSDLSRDLRRLPPDPNFTMFATLHRALLAEGRRDGLTGIGGDDAFVAYGIGPRMVSAFKLRQGRVLKEVALRTAKSPRTLWPDIAKPTLGYVAGPWRRGGHPMWVSAQAARCSERLRRYRRHAPPVTGIDAIDERLGTLTAGYNASIFEDQAVVADWVGRRHSHPFLDPRFIKATYGLDPWWPAEGRHTRALEVDAFGDRLPAVVARRRSKAEFSEVFWPQVLDDATMRRVSTGPLYELGWLDRRGFEILVQNAKRGMANSVIPLFRCVSLDRWLQND